MRSPLRLRQWDSMACETACSAQILYMFDLMEESEIRSIDRMIGRRAHQADTHYGNVRLLLERGLHLRLISPANPEAIVGPNGMELVRKLWLEVGCSQREVDEDLPHVFPDIVASYQQSLAVRRRFRSQITSSLRMATKKDLQDMLAQNHLVFCAKLSSEGTTHTLLAIPDSRNTCGVYDPATGTVVRRTFSQLDREVAAYGNGWRLP